jgi:hypothetical protein
MPHETSLRQDAWTFLSGAKDHWKEIVGGSVVFLLIGVAASMGLNVPPVISGVAALCLAFSLACFLCWRDEHKKAQRLIPRLQVSIDQSRSITPAIWNNGNDLVTFFRLVVSSSTASRIEDAKGYLVSIEKDSKILWDSQEVPLTFAPGENADALSKTIEDGGKYPLDVLVLRHGDNDLFLGTPGRTWPHFTSLAEIFSEEGEYVLTIRISAKDCPSILAKMKFVWNGSASNCGIDLMAPS